MVVEPTRRLFTVDEFHRMADAGVFAPEDRVELLDGEIIEMTPIGPRHAGCVNRLTKLLIDRLGPRVVVGVQNPVWVDPRSEPQPDLSVARARDDFYSSAHPTPEDVLLLIEVSDTTQVYDRNRKVPRYASRGVPETWLVDLPAETVEVYRGQTPDGYEERIIARRGDTISPQAFSDVSIGVDEILGLPD